MDTVYALVARRPDGAIVPLAGNPSSGLSGPYTWGDFGNWMNWPGENVPTSGSGANGEVFGIPTSINPSLITNNPSTFQKILGSIGVGLSTFFQNRNTGQYYMIAPQPQQAVQTTGINANSGGVNLFGTQISFGTLLVVGLGIVLLQSRPLSRR
jgi:hypothetical protein